MRRYRVVASGLVLVGAVLGTSACDPSPPGTDVVLVRSLDGRLQLVVNLCDSTLDEVEIGAGDDWSRRGGVHLEPTSELQGRVVIDLLAPGDAFRVEGADELASLDVPFFTTVWVDDGELASQAFATLPGPGEMTYVSPETGEPVSASVDEIDELQTCPG